ncbi:MAG TPA: thioesterase family protein [Longimicrobiaceae bacterium]|nr:thioesterase family protein [Longimicrobiaceae bacterium]
MNLIFRTLRVALTSLRRHRLRPLDTSVVVFHVLPNDLDINFHMNNGRYLSLMDLGRLDLMMRIGVMRQLFRCKWRPVIGSLSIRFRRSLSPFQRYEIHTRLLCWDDKWMYLEQRFMAGGEMAAIALVKGLFLQPNGTVPPQAVVDLANPDLESPPFPEVIVAWQRSENALRAADTGAERP